MAPGILLWESFENAKSDMAISRAGVADAHGRQLWLRVQHKNNCTPGSNGEVHFGHSHSGAWQVDYEGQFVLCTAFWQRAAWLIPASAMGQVTDSECHLCCFFQSWKRGFRFFFCILFLL